MKYKKTVYYANSWYVLVELLLRRISQAERGRKLKSRERRTLSLKKWYRIWVNQNINRDMVKASIINLMNLRKRAKPNKAKEKW